MRTKTTNKRHISATQKLIAEFDLTAWSGEPGEPIQIVTRGDPNDQFVSVAVKNIAGIVLEEGAAAYDEPTKTWVYLTTTHMPRDEILLIFAMAASSDDCHTVIGSWLPRSSRFASEFKTAPWARASGLGQWRNN